MFCQQKDCELYTLQLFCEDFKMSSESSGLFNHWHNQMAKKIYDNSKLQTFFYLKALKVMFVYHTSVAYDIN